MNSAKSGKKLSSRACTSDCGCSCYWTLKHVPNPTTGEFEPRLRKKNVKDTSLSEQLKKKCPWAKVLLDLWHFLNRLWAACDPGCPNFVQFCRQVSQIFEDYNNGAQQ